MPNHCQNYLILRHDDPTQIERAKNAIENGFLFQEFHPCPQELTDTTAGFLSGDEQKELELKSKANLEKYGYANWYDWQCANWGTKWDAYDLDIISESAQEIAVTFDTAWSPPIEFYNVLLEQGFQIDAMYNEFGCAFCGEYYDGNEHYYEYARDRCNIPKEIDEQFGITETLEEWDSYEEEDEEEIDEEETLMDQVIEQIRKDINSGDYTAIEEMLKSVPEEVLKSFLSET